jgi:hypothetical protein
VNLHLRRPGINHDLRLHPRVSSDHAAQRQLAEPPTSIIRFWSRRICQAAASPPLPLIISPPN